MPSLDAETLRDAMDRFRRALEEHRDEINSLNVYPVPDGDTGTNMLLTQQAVDDELRATTGGDLPQVGSAIARAALMGARGNSGVILAQALRGFVAGLDGAEREVDAEGLGLALDRAAEEAYRAVATPVRGTILDVLADAARAAQAAAAGGDVEAVSRAALEEGRASLAKTKEILPDLRRAGVVDAGGRGILLLLDALHAAVANEPMTEPVGPFGPIGRGGAAPHPGAPAFKFEVQFLLEADDLDVVGLRPKLVELGDSLVVVGGDGTYKVHLHTNDPGAATELAEATGRTSSVSVTDLEGDVERCLVGEAREVRTTDEQVCALVAVADGEGIASILSSLGALVVPGGPGNNPSVGEIVRVIDAASSRQVVVLPNHANVVPAARTAAAEAAADAIVVPTLSIPQGVSAAAAFHPGTEPGANVRALAEASEAVAWGEVARAVRDADTPAGPVRAGQLLATEAGEVVAVGDDAASLVVDLVRRLRDPAHEVLTVFTGEDVGSDEAAAMERALRTEVPDLELEIHAGGQPGYPYLIGLE